MNKYKLRTLFNKYRNELTEDEIKIMEYYFNKSDEYLDNYLLEEGTSFKHRMVSPVFGDTTFGTTTQHLFGLADE